jgi:antirestriction protein ArdC
MRVRNSDMRDEFADAFLHSTGADIREGQGEAFYVPSRDFISMPAFDAFKGADLLALADELAQVFRHSFSEPKHTAAWMLPGT